MVRPPQRFRAITDCIENYLVNERFRSSLGWNKEEQQRMHISLSKDRKQYNIQKLKSDRRYLKGLAVYNRVVNYSCLAICVENHP